MTKLSEKDVEHVAKLAKISLTEQELKKYQKQLSGIVEYISALQRIDTTNVEPTNQTSGLLNVFRTDEVKPQTALSREEALSGKDNTVNGFFSVPEILKERADK